MESIPEDMQKAFVEEYVAGATLKQLAVKYGVAPNTVWRYVDRAGVLRKKSGASKVVNRRYVEKKAGW